MPRPAIPFFLLFVLCLAHGIAVLAPAAVPLGEWTFQNWKIEDGLPDNNVSEIRQMADGGLVIATYGGLSRFDGWRLSPFEVESGNGHSSLIRAMIKANNGDLWLAIGQGKILRHRAEGQEVYNPPHRPDSYPSHLCEDREGGVWISYSDGEVVRIHNSQMEFYGRDQGLPGDAVCKFAVDAAGSLWATAGEALYRLRSGRFEKVASVEVTPNWRKTTCIAPAGDGGLWLSAGLRLYHYKEDGAGLVSLPTPSENPDNTSISMVYEDRQRRLWVCLFDGNVYLIQDGRMEKAGTALHEITAITDDHEGNLWLGASEGGVWRVRSTVLKALAEEDPLVVEAMCSAAQDSQGRMWLSGTNGFLYRKDVGKWSRLGVESGWTPEETRTLVASPDGSVWIGTKDEGVFQAGLDGTFRPVPFPGPKPWGNIRAMLLSKDGRLWVAINADLWCLQEGRWRLYSSNLQSSYIQTLACTTDGTLWAGTSEGQLLTVRGNALVDVAPPGFGDAAVRGLLAAPDGSLWMGRAGEGLTRLRSGQFSHVGREQGLDRSGISHLEMDDQGRLWCGSAQGIFALPFNDLETAADHPQASVQLNSYGRDEGLPSLQSSRGYWPNSLKDHDGRIWFNLRTGTVLALPDNAGRNTVPPPVSIEAVMLDDKPLPLLRPLSGKPLVIPPGHRSLDIRFAAMSFRSPQNVRIRYQLVGLDTGWMEGSEERHAVYSRLPAGDYTFKVTAANDSGVWNETGARLPFTVMPPFWQTSWFQALALLATFATIIGGSRFIINRRWRRRMAGVERQAALERERTRIARDMHDELGASLTQIAIAGQLAKLDPPEASPGHIADIAAIARRAVTSLDEIVWAVNPRNDTLSSLLDYMSQYAVDFLTAAGLECELDLPLEVAPRPVTAEFRHHLFLAVKETLTNVVKHAGATKVVFRTILTSEGLELEIADNGRGFDSSTLLPGADGLRNLQERLAELQGSCEILGLPAQGTRVLMKMPWTVAAR